MSEADAPTTPSAAEPALGGAPVPSPAASTDSEAGSASSKPIAWVPSLYFAEGLPNVVTVVVSVLMYKSLGLSDGDIAFFTSLITYPWMLKPLWSPLLELVKSQKYGVVLTQFLGGVTFGCIALAIPTDAAVPATLALFALLAFNSATHDIFADGIYVSALSTKEQAQYVGVQGAAYNIARFLAQGAFVWLAGQLEKTMGVRPAWVAVMTALAALMVVLSAWHGRSLPQVPPSTQRPTSVADAFATFGDVVRTFFQKKNIWWAIAFICLYRFAEGNLVKIVPLFMRASREAGGLGLDTSQVGTAYGMVGSIAFVLGSLAGGWLTARRGLKRSLLVLCALFNVPFVTIFLLAQFQPTSMTAVYAAVWAETFGYGFGFVAIPLYIMQEVAPGPYKMAHYSFGTALMFLGFLAPSSVSGYVSDALGYRMHFVWCLVATIPSFFVAWRVPVQNEAPRTA